MKAIIATILLLSATPALASLDVPPPTPNLTNYATKADVAAASVDLVRSTDVPALVAANIPFANTVAPTEAPAGSIGTATTVPRSDRIPPRISRTGSCTLNAAGTCSGNWDTSSFPAGATIRLTGDPAPINSAATAAIQCNATSLTLSGYSVKCWTSKDTLLNIGIIGSGLTVSPNGVSGAGVEVQVVAIMKS